MGNGRLLNLFQISLQLQSWSHCIEYLTDGPSWTSTIPAGLMAGEYVSIPTVTTPSDIPLILFPAYQERDVCFKRLHPWQFG